MLFFSKEKTPKLPKIKIENNDENSFLKNLFEGLQIRLKKNSFTEEYHKIYEKKTKF